MPYVSNPLYTDSQSRNETNVAKIAESLGSIFGGGDPMEMAKAAALGAGHRKDMAEALLSEDELAARQGLGSVFGSFMTQSPDGATAMLPETDFRAQTIKALPELIRAGQGANVRDILSVPGIASGDDKLASMGSLFLRSQGPNDTFSLDDREGVAGRIAQDALNESTAVQQLKNEGDLAVERIKPKTTDQLKAEILASEFSPESLGEIFLTDQIGDVTPRNVVLPGVDGGPARETTAVGNMYRDETGAYQPIPFGSQVWTAQSTGEGPKNALGLTNSVQTTVQKQILALDSLDNTVAAIENIATNAPENFGTAGVLKSTAQDLMAQGDALGQLLADQADQVQFDIAERGDTVSPSYFDPSLPALDLLTNTLAYQYATGIAGNDRISDSDFTVAKQAVGDPSSWLGSAEKTRAKMAAIKQMSQNRRRIYSGALQSGAVGGAGPAPGAPVLMRDPDGNLFEIDPAEQNEAEQNGWSIAQ
jgi:hypothetical protein